MKTITFAFLLTFSLRLTFAQNATIPILKLNQPLEQQIKAGETQTFQIALQAGEFMHVEAIQKGVDIVLRLIAPDGQLLTAVNVQRNTGVPEIVSYYATRTGVFNLAVSVWEQATVKQGRYAIKLRQGVPRERAIALVREGRRLSSVGRKADAITILNKALTEIKKPDGQSKQESEIYENLGQLHLDIGELSQARESYQKAFKVARDLGDSYGIVANSQNLGRVRNPLNAKNIKAELVVKTGHLQVVWSVAFAPNGNLLASGSIDHTIKLWDVRSQAEVRTLSGHSGTVSSVAFAPDGKTLVSGSEDKTIKLWDVASGLEIRTFSGHQGAVHSVAFAPDGKAIASGSEDKTIKLWDVVSGNEMYTFSGHTDDVASIAFAPDGRTLASGSFDRTIKLWNMVAHTELLTFSGHLTPVRSVAFSPDGKMLASGSLADVKLWDIVSGNELRTFSGHADRISAIAFAPDGKTLASGSEDKTIKLWDVVTGNEMRTLSGHKLVVRDIAYSPDGKMLASGSFDSTIKLWDVASGKDQNTLSGRGEDSAIAISPNGKVLAIGNRRIKLWDLPSGTLLKTLSGHDAGVSTVSFSADGNSLASGGWDSTIKLWDIASRTEIRTLSGHKNWVYSVAFAPSGKTIASGSLDEMVKLWDVASGNELHTFPFGDAASVAFSQDSKTLAGRSLGVVNNLAGDTQYSQFWDSISGKPLPVPNPIPREFIFNHEFPLRIINGNSIFVAQDRGQTHFINYNNGETLGSLITFDQDDWVVMTPDGLFDASPGAMKLMHFVISGIEEGYAVVTLEQLKDRYYQPNLLPKLLGYDNTPIKEIPLFTGEKLFPKLEYKLQDKEQTKLDINLHNRGGGIGEVAVLVNGKTFLQDARPRGFNPNAKDAAFTVELKDAPFLPGTSNQIEVIARNAEGWLTSPRGIAATYKPDSAAKPDAELWAIVGGVSDYEGTQLDLHFAAKDAEDFANAIKLGGYRLFGANRVHLETLTTNNQDPKLLPTKENFRRVFTEFQKAKPNDVLLVYLSGHGVAFRVNGDKVLYNYLTQAATNGDVKDSDVRGKVAITSDELMEWIRLIPTNKNVLVFDTCAAGAFADNLNLALKKDEAGENLDNQQIAMTDLKYRMGFHILMGAAADKPSYETSQFNQGLLTYALLEGIKFGAVNDKKIVNVSELFQYARNRVPKLAESIGNVNIQTPQIAAPQGETFPLLQMTVNESELIHLEKERPILMRPRLVNLDDPDDVEVENRLIRQLKEASQPVKRGEAARSSQVVFLETWELPSATKPSGSYKYDGEQVTVNLKLLRDKQTVGALTVVGKKSDLRGLVEKLIAELVVAIEKVPKTTTRSSK